jgi:hypothetical protein
MTPNLPGNEKLPPSWAFRYQAGDYPPYGYTADVVGFGVRPTLGTLEVVTVTRGEGGPYAGATAFPGGFVEWRSDADAQTAAIRELDEETGLGEPAHIETLDTYDTNGRDPRQWAGYSRDGKWVSTGARIVSKSFLALFASAGEALAPKSGEDATAASWRNVYDFLPWEDVRESAGRALARSLGRELLEDWADSRVKEEAHSRARLVKAAFPARLAEWNEERAPERYRLLLGAGLVPEAHRDKWGMTTWNGERATRNDAREASKKPRASNEPHAIATGEALAFDHRLMLADALGRLRGKLKYIPGVLSALLGREVALPVLQAACEAIGGRPIVTPNFRRVMTTTHALLERRAGHASERAAKKGIAPALYAFRADVGTLRLDPSIRMPWAPLQGR